LRGDLRVTAGDLERLIDFDEAVVISPMIYPPRPRLVVSGEAPYAGMEVTLVPLVYVSQPPYWGIQVVGRPGGDVAAAVLTPYQVEIDLAGITGTQGVEVIGASRTQQLTVASETSEDAATI
jgi:hypothetical protein